MLPPLDDGTFPLQQRLFPDFRGCTFYGRDVFSLISGQAWLFWRNTGETPSSFLRLALDLLPALSSLTACGQPRISRRRQKITLINQVLLTIIWLRKYPHVDTLSLWFDNDPSSVVRIVYKVFFQNFDATSKIKKVGPLSLNGEILREIGKNFLM